MFIHMLLEVFINTRSNLPSNFPMYAVHILCKGFNIFSWSRFYEKNHQVGGQSWTNTHEHCIRNLHIQQLTKLLDQIGYQENQMQCNHLSSFAKYKHKFRSPPQFNHLYVDGMHYKTKAQSSEAYMMFSKITQELDVYIGKSSSVVSTLHLPATSYSLNLQRRKKLQMRFLHKPK